jgi:hypothetical protein
MASVSRFPDLELATPRARSSPAGRCGEFVDSALSPWLDQRYGTPAQGIVDWS